MSNLIQAVVQYGALLTTNGLAGDADREALSDNLAEIYRAKAYARLQEVDALQQGASQAGRVQLQAGQLEGQQRVAYALSGVDASSGSAAATINSSRLFSELDAATARNNAMRAAMGHRRAQDLLDMKAGQLRRDFRNNQTRRTAEAATGAANVIGEALSFGGV